MLMTIPPLKAGLYSLSFRVLSCGFPLTHSLPQNPRQLSHDRTSARLVHPWPRPRQPTSPQSPLQPGSWGSFHSTGQSTSGQTVARCPQRAPALSFGTLPCWGQTLPSVVCPFALMLPAPFYVFSVRISPSCSTNKATRSVAHAPLLFTVCSSGFWNLL